MERNESIDTAKYIASIMVVARHTVLSSDMNLNMPLFIVNILCKLAVPFFAICTGYFLYQKIECEDGCLVHNEHNLQVFFLRWKKIFKLYMLWSLIYMLFSIPKWIEIGWFSAWAFIDFTVALILKGSYYHFWYLLGAIYALPVIYFILQKVKMKHIPYAICILYTMKVLWGGTEVFYLMH